MISPTQRRREISGQSFGTCLLLVVLFFGGIGAYYFKIFQWRHLEDPGYDLLIVEKSDPAELAFFRKKTVPDFVDPALIEMSKVIKLRKAADRGKKEPENFGQETKEIANRLREIMNGAKLRQIPKNYSRQYKDVLVGISEIYRSLRALEEAVATEIPEEKEKAIKESIQLTKKAEKKLNLSRTFFHVK